MGFFDCAVEIYCVRRHSGRMKAAPLDATISHEKRKMREMMLRKRMQLPHPAMVQSSESVARHFADHPILAFAPSFSGYVAMRGELDVLAIFRIMARFDKQTALPCLTDHKMLQFRSWRPNDTLVRHRVGTQEPIPTAPTIIPSVVLVPLLAFDGMGGRIGYGAGYYDRTMAMMRRFETPPLFIGVAYSMQEVEHVPVDAHDAPLDGILTELGVSMFQ